MIVNGNLIVQYVSRIKNGIIKYVNIKVKIIARANNSFIRNNI